MILEQSFLHHPISLDKLDDQMLRIVTEGVVKWLLESNHLPDLSRTFNIICTPRISSLLATICYR